MTLRPATDQDSQAVFALGVAEEEAWFGEAEISADEVGEWVEDEGGVAGGVVAVDEAGQVHGFALAGRRQSLFLADPAWLDSVGDELLTWLCGQREVVDVMTFAGDAARLAAFERHGLRHHRSSFLLARPEAAGPLSAPAFPDGISVAPYRFGDDDQAVHRLIYVDGAWASVPGHAERDLEDWRQMAHHCDSLFLARRDGRPVGWVASRQMASGRGYVDTLVVAVDERRHGLGRALLLHAFADLQRTGARGLMLAVEGSNEAALDLYRSVGMDVEREWRTYGTARR